MRLIVTRYVPPDKIGLRSRIEFRRKFLAEPEVGRHAVLGALVR
jgi:hypothetical protein